VARRGRGERAGHRTLDAVPRRRRHDDRGYQGRRPHDRARRPRPATLAGASRQGVREDAENSLRNLGVDRLDLYYAHIDDRSAPLAETVDALAGLAESGKAGLLGASNTATWRIERARGLARAAGRPGYSCVQQQHTYLLAQPEPGQLSLITEELLDYARSEQLTLLAYSPLLAGAYAHPDRSVPAAYQHAANHARLATLSGVATAHGATPNQVVLAWLLHRQPALIPVPGASSVAQLDEILAATELKLNAETLDRLDRAGRFAS
jgi:aryl-alcohol dehydrogenase-like predicted oxidoreductase